MTTHSGLNFRTDCRYELHTNHTD